MIGAIGFIGGVTVKSACVYVGKTVFLGGVIKAGQTLVSRKCLKMVDDAKIKDLKRKLHK